MLFMRVEKDIIKLPLGPTDSTKPDYQFMETYIKAIEKLTIKDVSVPPTSFGSFL